MRRCSILRFSLAVLAYLMTCLSGYTQSPTLTWGNATYANLHTDETVHFGGKTTALVDVTGGTCHITVKGEAATLDIARQSLPTIVAVVTAVTLCLPIAQELDLDPLLIALGSGAGARLICHVNDSFFWVFAKMSGLDVPTALKTLSVSNLAMAFSGLAETWIVSLVIT